MNKFQAKKQELIVKLTRKADELDSCIYNLNKGKLTSNLVSYLAVGASLTATTITLMSGPFGLYMAFSLAGLSFGLSGSLTNAAFTIRQHKMIKKLAKEADELAKSLLSSLLIVSIDELPELAVSSTLRLTAATTSVACVVYSRNTLLPDIANKFRLVSPWLGPIVGLAFGKPKTFMVVLKQTASVLDDVMVYTLHNAILMTANYFLNSLSFLLTSYDTLLTARDILSYVNKRQPPSKKLREIILLLECMSFDELFKLERCVLIKVRNKGAYVSRFHLKYQLNSVWITELAQSKLIWSNQTDSILYQLPRLAQEPTLIVENYCMYKVKKLVLRRSIEFEPGCTLSQVSLVLKGTTFHPYYHEERSS